MRVVCVSDTHGLHTALQEASPIPPGDVFVHAGDFTDTGARDEVLAFNAWLATLPHKYKIVIAGNHESSFDRAFYPHNWYNYGHAQQYDPREVRALLTNALYLEDQSVLVDGFLFYGSPWQPEFCNWAFNLPRGDKLVAKWQMIPSDVDVLITHSPPMGRGDQVGHMRVGCSDLLHEIQTRIKPPYHVFGHVHEGYGRSSDGVTTFLNASSCTYEYEAVNAPMVFDLEAPRTIHNMAMPTNQAIRYEVLLHEQLRVCSQKPVFVPVAGTAAVALNGNRTHPHGPYNSHSLKEFCVDGTTAALLFESTLKLRPVKAKQTRALRYLFHHGFTGKEGDASAVGSEDGGAMEEDAQERNGQAAIATATENGQGNRNGTDSKERRRERRRLSLARRVTMAVLEELPDATRDAIAPTAAALITASTTATTTTETVTTTGTAPSQRRTRRDKTLHRREAVAKLATMVEEPEKEAAAAAEMQVQVQAQTLVEAVVISTPPSNAVVASESNLTVQVQTSTSISTSCTIIPAPCPPPPIPAPAKECIMCKYNVAGHIHPGSDKAKPLSDPPGLTASTPPLAPTTTAVPPKTSAVPSPAAPTPVTEAIAVVITPATPAAPTCILCKYKVAGHVHPGAEPAPTEVVEDSGDREDGDEDEGEDGEAATTATTTNRLRAVGPKRLSSWF